MRYLRLWWQFLLTALVRQAEYRVDFVLTAISRLGSLAVVVLSFELLYRYTDVVAGWSRADILLLVGIYRVFNAVWDLAIWPNLTAVSGLIEQGEMDFLLLRPVSSQFLVSLRRLDVPRSVDLLSGLALAIYAGGLAGVHWSLLSVAEAIAFGVCGLVCLYGLRFIWVTLSFWLVSVTTFADLLHDVHQASRYPATFFKGWVRTVLTFVVPIAFATTFPAQALLGGVDHRLLPLGAALAAALLLASHAFWNLAVRHYSSASS